MPVQPHVIIETVHQKQGRHRCLRAPDLADQFEACHLEAPQPAVGARLSLGQVQPVETLISLRTLRQRLHGRQRRQAGTQGIGLERCGHKGFRVGSQGIER
ncbi:hypothetical protein D3C80_1719150 [compost metagenome]